MEDRAKLAAPTVYFIAPPDGKLHTSPCDRNNRLSIIRKIPLGREAAAFRREHGVATFEEFGRKLDREIERLREIAEKKISPAARLKTARSLRRMSDKLAQMAADLEAKVEPKPDQR